MVALNGTGSLDGAVAWIGDAMIGPSAMAIGSLAIGTIGILLLAGRIPIQQATRAVVGCFAVFAASTIAQGLIGYADTPSLARAEASAPVSPIINQNPPSSAFDPYAGAAVPLPQEQPVFR